MPQLTAAPVTAASRQDTVASCQNGTAAFPAKQAQASTGISAPREQQRSSFAREQQPVFFVREQQPAPPLFFSRNGARPLFMCCEQKTVPHFFPAQVTRNGYLHNK
jgi:hypothetical protein